MMFNLGSVFLYKIIVYCSEIILKINITPFGENFCYSTYRDKIQNLQGYILKKKISLRNFGIETLGADAFEMTSSFFFSKLCLNQ